MGGEWREGKREDKGEREQHNVFWEPERLQEESGVAVLEGDVSGVAFLARGSSCLLVAGGGHLGLPPRGFGQRLLPNAVAWERFSSRY